MQHKSSSARGLRAFVPYYKKYKWRFAILLAVMLTASSMGVVLSYISGRQMIAISGLEASKMVRWTLMMLLVVTIHHTAWFLWDRFASEIGGRIAADIRRDIIRRIADMRLIDARKENTGYYLERLNDDTEEVSFFVQNVAGTLVDVFTNISFLVIVYTQSWQCALLFTVGIAVLYIIDVIRIRVETNWLRRTKETSEKLDSTVIETLKGLKEIHDLGANDAAADRGVTVSDTLSRKRVIMKIRVTLLERARTYGQWVLDALLVFLCAFKLIPEGKITAVVILIIFNYKGLMYETIGYFSKISGYFVQGNMKANRILEILDDNSHKKTGHKMLKGTPNTIEIKDLSFSYGTENIISAFSMDIKEGTVNLISGQSGCGKSTLLSSIAGALPIHDGRIFIGGVDINDADQKELISKVGLVGQEPFFFNDTILENLRIAAPDADIAKIREACCLAHIDSEINNMPDGYMTVMTENSDNLSGGQRQRLSLARMLLKDPPILLLDEPTSALDGENRRLFYETIKELKGRKTIIIVSHVNEETGLYDQIINM